MDICRFVRNLYSFQYQNFIFLSKSSFRVRFCRLNCILNYTANTRNSEPDARDNLRHRDLFGIDLSTATTRESSRSTGGTSGALGNRRLIRGGESRRRRTTARARARARATIVGDSRVGTTGRCVRRDLRLACQHLGDFDPAPRIYELSDTWRLLPAGRHARATLRERRISVHL